MSFPREQVPEQVWNDLSYEVARHNLEYDSHWRAYRRCDGFLIKDFKLEERRGCCGQFETSTFVDGDVWIIACNYGH